MLKKFLNKGKYYIESILVLIIGSIVGVGLIIGGFVGEYATEQKIIKTKQKIELYESKIASLNIQLQEEQSTNGTSVHYTYLTNLKIESENELKEEQTELKQEQFALSFLHILGFVGVGIVPLSIIVFIILFTTYKKQNALKLNKQQK